MKSLTTLLISIVVVSLTLIACSKKSSVDTTAFENAFQSVEPAIQTTVDKVVASIKSADYSDAVTQLQSLAKEAKLTDAQQQAIKDLIGQVQQAIANTASQAASDANKAAGDLQKSLKP